MRMCRRNKKILSGVMTMIILMTTITYPIAVEGYEDKVKKEIAPMEDLIAIESRDTYRSYLDRYQYVGLPQNSFILQGEDYSSANQQADILTTVYKDREALIWKDYGGKVSWEVDIREEGLYRIEVGHASINENIRPSSITIAINEEVPFESAKHIKLSKLWEDEGTIIKDANGNDLKPKQIPSLEWINTVLHDIDGIYNEPYLFYFKKGKNTVTLEMQEADIALDYIKIYNEPEPLAYEEWYKQEKSAIVKSEDYLKIIEAERATTYKSDSTLSPMYDRSSPLTSPQDPVNLRYNIIGGSNWKYTGQWISWEFDIEKAGYYQIGMKARQNIRNGMTSYRRIYIDGKVPYQELMNVEFPFKFNWYMKTLGDNEPFLFYLDEGIHEIKLEIIPGEMSTVYAALEKTIVELNELYRKIFMITGPSPDTLRDYMVEQQIPGLLDQINKSQQELENIRDQMIRLSGEKGSEVSVFDKLIVQLESFVEEPDNIAYEINEFNNNIGSLASWMSQLKEQPLEIDYFYIKSEDSKLPEANGNFLRNLWFNMQSIWASFTEDYSSSTSNVKQSEDVLEVWIGVGRDQLNIVQELVDEYFTPQTGIKVNVSLVQRSILEPILAGKGPDVTLLTSSSEVMNLAFRDALVDMSEFEDFDTVTEWFQEEAFVPYQLEGSTYAIPLVQSFPMLFYRKDILEDMNLEVPRTWEELHEVNDILQRKYMQIGVPASIDTFAMKLYQSGGDLYTDDFKQTTFDDEVSIQSFIEWTDLYTKRGYPLSYDFYNRFRRGELPIGIAPYTTYTMLEVAAPEIKGLWGMTQVIGTPDENGNINQTTTSVTKQGAMILKSAENKGDAWEFVKWFASPDMQAEFGIAVENLMGPLGRYAPANCYAFERLPWSHEEQEAIMAQWKALREVPEVPGNYYVTRQLDYAFRSVVNDFNNPRHEINRYNKIINEEIQRKRKDLRLD